MKTKISTLRLEAHCDRVASLLKSLSHPGRLLIMGHLIGGEKTVTELQERSGLSQSQLSQFLARMKLEGLIRCERRGRFQFYSAGDERIISLIQAVQKIYC